MIFEETAGCLNVVKSGTVTHRVNVEYLTPCYSCKLLHLSPVCNGKGPKKVSSPTLIVVFLFRFVAFFLSFQCTVGQKRIGPNFKKKTVPAQFSTKLHAICTAGSLYLCLSSIDELLLSSISCNGFIHIFHNFWNRCCTIKVKISKLNKIFLGNNMGSKHCLLSTNST